MSVLILAVDSDPALRAHYRDLCAAEGWGCEGRDAPRGPAAVFALAPDLILLELLFGDEVTGYGFAAMLTARPLIVRIPVIVYTVWPQAVGHRAGLPPGRCPCS